MSVIGKDNFATKPFLQRSRVREADAGRAPTATLPERRGIVVSTWMRACAAVQCAMSLKP